MKGSYAVSKTGVVKGIGELATYGMEAWSYVRQSDKASEGFVRPVVVS